MTTEPEKSFPADEWHRAAILNLDFCKRLLRDLDSDMEKLVFISQILTKDLNIERQNYRERKHTRVTPDVPDNLITPFVPTTCTFVGLKGASNDVITVEHGAKIITQAKLSSIQSTNPLLNASAVTTFVQEKIKSIDGIRKLNLRNSDEINFLKLAT